MKKELICISCPIGCRLTIEYNEDKRDYDSIKVSGNLCPKGEIYGKEEILAPKRVVTATASIESRIQKRLPIKTIEAIDKDLIFDLLKEIYSLKLKPPVKIGDTIIKNFKKSGVDIVATANLPE
ncbi:MAG: molybdopterin oxidoreductase [Spirochaetes bacterium]|nr:MAG: molybdopterin oxidoreductase [Spirochaetota bacterium]RKY03550.1 MAG: molybdopterin oxidoreductase [Spirochaetota bacterium]